MANRLWAMMTGRGIVHPLDKNHSDNPASHPELLEHLAKTLSGTNFDTKTFLREIALSETYQRSSEIPVGVDPESFAVANMKGLSPEQLFESLLVATQADAVLEQQISDEVAEEADTSEENTSEEPDEKEVAENLAKLRRAKRASRVAEFISVFGSVPGQPEGEFSSSITHALFLANGTTVSNWIPPTRKRRPPRTVQ